MRKWVASFTVLVVLITNLGCSPNPVLGQSSKNSPATSVGNRLATPTELAKLQLIDRGGGVEPVSSSEVLFHSRKRILNTSNLQIASVTGVGQLYYRAMPSKVVFESSPIKIESFENLSVPIKGTLLPLNETAIVDFSYKADSSLFRTDIGYRLVLKSAEVRDGYDLNNPEDLYSKLVNTDAAGQQKIFDDNLKLLTVKTPDGVSGTMIAFATCAPETLEYLVKKGANTGDHDQHGNTILHMAAVGADARSAEIGLKFCKVDVANEKNETPLTRAVRTGNQGAAKVLIANGASIKVVASDGRNLGELAIKEEHPEMLKILVAAGESPLETDSEGMGWMEFASERTEDTIKAVLALGVPIDQANSITGKTPLMGVAEDQWPTQEFLLRNGANPDIRDFSGKTAYDWAKESNTLHSDRFFRQIVERARMQK